MSAAMDGPLPTSLWVAVIGAGISSLAILAIGIGSLAAGHAGFSLGIGLMLIAYSLVVALGSWLGLRRHILARGLIVAPALLNLATSISFLGAGDTAQAIGAGVAAVIFVCTIVAAVLPSTHRALQR